MQVTLFYHGFHHYLYQVMFKSNVIDTVPMHFMLN